MKRIHLLILCAVAILAVGLASYSMLTMGRNPGSATGATTPEDNDSRSDNATVSFGQWITAPPLDRFPNASPALANHHELIPQVAKIKAGGTVNFVIAGFHQVIVYDDGTRPGDINAILTVLPTAGGPPLINDPTNRIYRGLDPSLQPTDRVEVAHFPEAGAYLVICGVFPHFVNDRMFGFVRVLPKQSQDEK